MSLADELPAGIDNDNDGDATMMEMWNHDSMVSNSAGFYLCGRINPY